MPTTPPQVRVPMTGPSSSDSDRCGDDIAVGARVRVGHRDHGSSARVGGVRLRLVAAGQVPPDDLARELLQHELRGVTATGCHALNVDDQCLTADLGAQISVQLRPAARHHVGHVHIADRAAGLLVDMLAPAVHPVLVAQRHLVGERYDDHWPWRRASASREEST